MELVWLTVFLLFVGASWRLARILAKRRGHVEERLDARRDRWDERERGLFEREQSEAEPSDQSGESTQGDRSL